MRGAFKPKEDGASIEDLIKRKSAEREDKNSDTLKSGGGETTCFYCQNNPRGVVRTFKICHVLFKQKEESDAHPVSNLSQKVNLSYF